MPNGTYSALGPFVDKPYAFGERPLGSHIPAIPLLSGKEAWDSLRHRYDSKHFDSSGFMASSGARASDHPNDKKAAESGLRAMGLNELYKMAASPNKGLGGLVSKLIGQGVPRSRVTAPLRQMSGAPERKWMLSDMLEGLSGQPAQGGAPRTPPKIRGGGPGSYTPGRSTPVPPLNEHIKAQLGTALENRPPVTPVPGAAPFQAKLPPSDPKPAPWWASTAEPPPGHVPMPVDKPWSFAPSQPMNPALKKGLQSLGIAGGVAAPVLGGAALLSGNSPTGEAAPAEPGAPPPAAPPAPAYGDPPDPGALSVPKQETSSNAGPPEVFDDFSADGMQRQTDAPAALPYDQVPKPPPAPEPPAPETPAAPLNLGGAPGQPGDVAKFLGQYWPHLAAGGAGALGAYGLYNMYKQRQKKKQLEELLPYVMKAAADLSAFEAAHPLVAGFLRRCGEANLSEQQINEKIAQACRLDDSIRDAFEKIAIGPTAELGPKSPYGVLGGKVGPPTIDQPMKQPEVPLPQPVTWRDPPPQSPQPALKPLPPAPGGAAAPAPAPPKAPAPPRLGLPTTPENNKNTGSMFGDSGWSPTRAPYMKSTGQLDTEQGVTSDTTPRYGIMDSFGAGLEGAVGGLAGAVGNLGGMAAHPLASAGEGAGILPKGSSEAVGDWRMMASDLRDRGQHQFLNSTRSRALRDWRAHTVDNVTEHGSPLAQQAVARGGPVVDVAQAAIPYAAGTRLTAPSGAPGMLGKLPGVAGSAPFGTGAAMLTGNLYEGARDQALSQGARIELGMGGAPMLKLPGQQAVPLSQGDPAMVQAALQNSPGAAGQIDPKMPTPNNLKTPTQRIAGPAAPTAGEQMQPPGGTGDVATGPDGNPLPPQAAKELPNQAAAHLQEVLKKDPAKAEAAKKMLETGQPDPAMQKELVDKETEKFTIMGIDPVQAAQEAMQKVQSMPLEQQIPMWLSLGAGAIGLISALTSEEGGIGNWLMAVLGLGTAAGFGANAGLFGEGAQKGIQGIGGQLGSWLGMGGGEQPSPAPGQSPAAAKPPAAATPTAAKPAVSPASQKIVQELPSKYPWLSQYTGSNKVLDGSDMQGIVTSWANGNISDQQVQQVLKSLPPESRAEAMAGLQAKKPMVSKRWMPGIYGKMQLAEQWLQ